MTSQIPEEDFMDIFSSVAKFSTLWIFLAYVAYLDWDLHYVDVVAVSTALWMKKYT